jgi:LAO/AO transport system kinase
MTGGEQVQYAWADGLGLTEADGNDMSDQETTREEPRGTMLERLLVGDRRVLARALTLVESGDPQAAEMVAACQQAMAQDSWSRRGVRLGLTGAPGAGKSTLVEGLTRALRQRGKSVAVLAIDPSSPLTGGAILGDRIRMQSMAGDDGVFIRSMATRGHLGGVAAATEDALTLIESAGWDVLLVETTGVGQAEVEVVPLVDAVAVVLAPGMGDAVQAMKAGVLEIADVLALNKADRDGIDELEQEMAAAEALAETVTARAPRRMVRTVATNGEGVGTLLDALLEIADDRGGNRLRQSKQNAHRVAHSRVSVPQINHLEINHLKIDHLGIAVRSLDAAEGFYRALGLEPQPRETIAAERVCVTMMATGESRIELLEATDAESTIARFLARRGEGLHHVALRVRDLEDVVARLRQQGVRLVNEQIQVGAGGHRYVFVHPASAHGVLLELVEAAH